MQMHAEDLTPATEINAMIARHGHRRIIMALAAAMFQRTNAPSVLHEGALSDHMRQDIGLPTYQDQKTAYFRVLR